MTFPFPRLIHLVSLLLLVALAITACAPTTPSTGSEVPSTEAQPESGEEAPAAAELGRGTDGTVTLLYWQAVSVLNPYLSSGNKDLHAASVILEPLFNYSPAGELIPLLVTDIPTLENGGVSEDLTSITWTLQEGILWSDGTPLTAEDVVFTWEYCTHPDMGCSSATSFEGITSVEAVDDLTVKITFDGPKPYPYSAFGGQLAPILQKAQFADCLGAAASGCSEANTGPIGTGPYKVSDFRANDVVVFTVNENYREENKPHFAEVVMKGGGDAAAAARAVLETGEADYGWNLQVEPQILADMQAAGQGTVASTYSGLVERILINFTDVNPDLGDQRGVWTPEGTNAHPFLTDPAVRQALSMAIDRNIIAEQLYGFTGKATCNALSGPEAVASTANDGCLTQDIEGAKALLEEAGWVDSNGDGIREKDGVELSLLYQTSTNSVRQKTQALIKQWWEEIGIATELRNIDSAVFFGGDPASPDTLGKFYADVQMYAALPDSPDPQNYLANWLCQDGENIASPATGWLGNNVERWCNPEYDALYVTLTQTANLDERAVIAKQLNDMLAQDYVNLPLVFRSSVSAYSNALGGVDMNAWDSELWNLEDWYRVRE